MTTQEKIEAIRNHYSKPENFGSIYWGFLHLCVLMNESKFTVDKMQEFMEFVKEYLPCETCKQNLQKKLDSFPFTQELRLRENSASKYINTIHNMANISLKKPLMSYEEHIDLLFSDIND